MLAQLETLAFLLLVAVVTNSTGVVRVSMEVLFPSNNGLWPNTSQYYCPFLSSSVVSFLFTVNKLLFHFGVFLSNHNLTSLSLHHSFLITLNLYMLLWKLHEITIFFTVILNAFTQQRAIQLFH
jgi:hypothetical protein